MSTTLLAAIAVAVMIAGCSQAADGAGQSRISVEQLFAGGPIFDGSGNTPFLADLGISDGKINGALAGVPLKRPRSAVDSL